MAKKGFPENPTTLTSLSRVPNRNTVVSTQPAESTWRQHIRTPELLINTISTHFSLLNFTAPQKGHFSTFFLGQTPHFISENQKPES